MPGLSFNELQTFDFREGRSWALFAVTAAGWSLLTRVVLAFASARAYAQHKMVERLRQIPAEGKTTWAAQWMHRFRTYFDHWNASKKRSTWTFIGKMFGRKFIDEMLGRGTVVNDAGLSFLLGAVEFMVYPVLMFLDGWTFLGGWMAAKIAVVWRAGATETTGYERTLGRDQAGSAKVKAMRKDDNRKFGNRFTIYLIATVCVVGVSYLRAEEYFNAKAEPDNSGNHTCVHVISAQGDPSTRTITIGGFASKETTLKNKVAADRARGLIDSLLVSHGSSIHAAFVVGSADRRPLEGRLKEEMGENSTLARARAEYVKDMICRSTKVAPGLCGKVMTFSSGAVHHGHNVNPEQLARDRSVQVILFVQP